MVISPEVRRWLLRVRCLIRKELQVLLKDPKSRAILIIPVFLQALLFGYAANYELSYAPYVLLDECHSKASDDLLARIDSSGIFVRKLTVRSQREMGEAVESGAVALAIRVPSDFASRLSSGRTAPLQIVLDGRNSVTSGLAGAYLSSIVSSYAAELSGRTGSVELVRRAWYNTNLDSRWNILVALIATLALIQTQLTAAFTVAREREQGTFDQLLVTPLTPVEILAGKALPPILVGLVQSTLILLVIRFWFEIPFSGSLITLYLGLLAFNLATVGFGLSISALSLSMQQAMLYNFLCLVPTVMLSGFFTPVSNMAPALQYLTYVNPLRFGIDIVKRVYLEGAGLAQVWPDFIPLALIAAFCLPAAGWLFRNKLS
ncbi:MAG: ABC transporter permease [Mesosutterella sp.]|nr:ABC transporter permease [Mesosutterella sp.]